MSVDVTHPVCVRKASFRVTSRLRSPEEVAFGIYVTTAYAAIGSVNSLHTVSIVFPLAFHDLLVSIHISFVRTRYFDTTLSRSSPKLRRELSRTPRNRIYSLGDTVWPCSVTSYFPFYSFHRFCVKGTRTVLDGFIRISFLAKYSSRATSAFLHSSGFVAVVNIVVSSAKRNVFIECSF